MPLFTHPVPPRPAGDARPRAERRGAGDYSELHCRDGAVHLHQKSLSALVRRLPGRFLRIHRSYIVGLDEIAAFRAAEGSRYSVRLRSGEELPVGRSRVAELRERLS